MDVFYCDLHISLNYVMCNDLHTVESIDIVGPLTRVLFHSVGSIDILGPLTRVLFHSVGSIDILVSLTRVLFHSVGSSFPYQGSFS